MSENPNSNASTMPPDDEITAAVNAEVTNIARIMAGFPGARMHTSAIRDLVALKEKGVEYLQSTAAAFEKYRCDAEAQLAALRLERDQWQNAYIEVSNFALAVQQDGDARNDLTSLQVFMHIHSEFQRLRGELEEARKERTILRAKFDEARTELLRSTAGNCAPL